MTLHPTFDTDAKIRGIEAAFPAAEFAERQARARAAITASGHEALIVTGPETIYWLTGRQTAGYFAFQALVLPADGEPVLLVRQLELFGTLANTYLPDIVAYQDADNPAEALVDLLRQRGIANPAIELAGWFLSPKLAAEISERLGVASLIDGSQILPSLRMIKSAAELEAIRHAARYAEAGMIAGIEACVIGADENAVAADMLHAATRAGSEVMAMEPLVSSGPRSGLPHMTWRRRVLEAGDPLFLELAGSHARYHAALMRTVWMGVPPDEAQRMMDCALRALDAALAEIRPGVLVPMCMIRRRQSSMAPAIRPPSASASAIPWALPSRRTGARGQSSASSPMSPASSSRAWSSICLQHCAAMANGPSALRKR